MPTLEGKEAEKFLKRMIKKENSPPTKKELEIIKDLERNKEHYKVTVPRTMNPSETATTLMNGCGKEDGWRLICGQSSFKNKPNLIAYCIECKSNIKIARKCWQEELERLEKLQTEFKFQFMKESNNLFWMTDKTITELKQALKITESVQ